MIAQSLELISLHPSTSSQKPPLLFVHGAYSSARIWTPFFLPYFAERGYAVHAVSLTGHGESHKRAGVRLRDYVGDIECAVEKLGSLPVLIGHSMGGLVVQHYLSREPKAAAAAVLMSSAPPHGTFLSGLAMTLTNPALAWQMTLMQNLGPEGASLAGAKLALFRNDTPDEYVRRVLPAPEPESHLAVLDMMGLDLPPATPKTRIPVLVMAGDSDPFVTVDGVDATARAFKTQAVLFPGMPHALMLDPEWMAVAQHINGWLDDVLT